MLWKQHPRGSSGRQSEAVVFAVQDFTGKQMAQLLTLNPALQPTVSVVCVAAWTAVLASAPVREATTMA